MKKLIFFITTLLFLIPRVNAENPIEYYLYYTQNSVDNFLPTVINGLNSYPCTYDYCVYGGSDKTILENLNSMVDALNSEGYKFTISIGSSSVNDDVVSPEFYDYINVFIYDPVKTYTDDFVVTQRYSNDYAYINGKYWDVHTFILKPSSTNTAYGWSFSTASSTSNRIFNINDINSYIDSNDSDFTNNQYIYKAYISPTNDIFFRGMFLFYTNVKYSYNISPYSFRIFTNYIGTSGTHLDFTINDTVGWWFNRTNMLSWYANNYTYDDDSSISPGDKPSGDDSDATNQDIVDGLGDLNSSIGDLNDSINSSDVNSDDYENFFSDFEDNNHGLLSFITAPLSFIQSLTNSTCTPITVPIPFVDSSVTLPCMTTIYQRYFGSFFTVYQMITNGIIAYWIGINCYRIVKNMKNPNSYYVEVMGL